MTDFELLIQTFQVINCNFTTVNTLIGKTLSVYSETCEMMFEFDSEGEFIRKISNPYKKLIQIKKQKY